MGDLFNSLLAPVLLHAVNPYNNYTDSLKLSKLRELIDYQNQIEKESKKYRDWYNYEYQCPFSVFAAKSKVQRALEDAYFNYHPLAIDIVPFPRWMERLYPEECENYRKVLWDNIPFDTDCSCKNFKITVKEVDRSCQQD